MIGVWLHRFYVNGMQQRAGNARVGSTPSGLRAWGVGYPGLRPGLFRCKAFGLVSMCMLGGLGGKAFGQWACLTMMTESSKARSLEFEPRSRSFVVGGGYRDVPVQFHIVQQDDGSHGLEPSEIGPALAAMNKEFCAAHVRFLEVGPPKVHKNSRFYEFKQMDIRGAEDGFCLPLDVAGVVNVYILGYISDSKGFGAAGYAHFPEDNSVRNNNRLFVAKDYVTGGSTLVHEMGHFFGLLHTHDTLHGIELADGSNADWAGDRIQDTPADPCLGGRDAYIANCKWTGNLRDPMGNYYQPDVTNFMSYCPEKSCRSHFSSGQIQAIMSYAIEGRPGLNKYLPAQYHASLNGYAGAVYFEANGRKLPVELLENMFRFKEPAYSGDAFRIYTDNNFGADCFVYAVNMDSRGVIKIIHGLETNPFVFKGSQKVNIPDQIVSLDDHTGIEYLCVLYSKEALDIGEYEALLESSSGTLMDRLYDVMGEKLLSPAEARWSADGGMMRFEAHANGGRAVLPIMMEMQHLSR